MNKQNNTKITWLKHNKKKIIIISGVVIAVGTGIVVFKNKDTLAHIVKKEKISTNIVALPDAQQTVEKISEVHNAINADTVISNKRLNNGLPFSVRGGIRNLSNNRHPSAKKMAQAKIRNIELGAHQTIVDSYMKNVIK